MLKPFQTADFWRKHLPETGAPPFFPVYSQRDSWEQVSPYYRDLTVQKAEQWLKQDFPSLSASLYGEFVTCGNRTRHSGPYFQRRVMLLDLTTAECLEGKGRFLQKIMDGVWAVCEESSWILPAHNPDGLLPDVTKQTYIDLFSAETASLLSWVYFFLKEPLDSISPLICQRIAYEIDRRIFHPFAVNSNMFWMCSKGQKANNWNPWIISNLLTVFFLLPQDREEQIQRIIQAIQIVERFYLPYPEDGGCDEGPGYWNAAAASFFDCLELLSVGSGGAVDCFKEPKVKAMGEYIYKVHISGNSFLNFADASPYRITAANLIHRYGEKTGSRQLSLFGLSQFQRDKSSITSSSCVYRHFHNVFEFQKMMEKEGATFLPEDYYLENLQIFTARSRDGRVFLGGKGGHNGESHNHNDVGQFLLAVDGEFVLIDPGVEAYTAKTFSDSRYEIWTMQSSYHNLPDINGFGQLPGTEWRAAEAQRTGTESEISFSLRLDTAYPPEAGLQEYRRRLTLHKENGAVDLKESFCFQKPSSEILFHFMTLKLPQISGKEILLSSEKGPVIRLTVPEQVAFSAEKLQLSDSKHQEDWGQDYMYRLTGRLVCPLPEKREDFLFQFELL